MFGLTFLFLLLLFLLIGQLLRRGVPFSSVGKPTLLQ
jgi:hypothetical protein